MSSINDFLNNITVLDTETTHLLPEQAEIVEIAAVRRIDDVWLPKGMLLGAVHGIPPEASAKNNISNKMIKDLPTFADRIVDIKNMLHWPHTQWYVAHNARYDREVLAMSWTATGEDDSVELCSDHSRWICTWRLSRHLLAHEFVDCEYGLNYLRYRLDLAVRDDMRLHRADDDAYLCAILLEYLTNYAVEKGFIDPAGNIGQQLNQLCWSPITQQTWPFGKYRGKPLSEIPNDYYTWAIKNIPALDDSSSEYDMDLSESVRTVLELRLLA